MPSDCITYPVHDKRGWLAYAYSMMAVSSMHPHREILGQARRTAATLLDRRIPEPIRDPLVWLAGYEPDDVELETLEVEFTRLFVNAYPKTPLPPYEAVQRGEGGLWGESTLDVVRSYAEAGLKYTRAHGVAPDHLSAEMEFAAFLLTSADASVGSEERTRFIAQYEHHFTAHLGPWVGEFCQKVERQTRVDFYRAFGRFGAALMALETERVIREGRAVCHG